MEGLCECMNAHQNFALAASAAIWYYTFGFRLSHASLAAIRKMRRTVMRNKISWMTRFLALTVAFCAAGRTWADVWTDPDTGYTWTYQVSGETAVIYKSSYRCAVSPAPTGVLTIPSTIEGYTVTSIGAYAFYYCSSLTSVTIPDSVTSIGYYAFEGCNNVKDATVPGYQCSILHALHRICFGLCLCQTAMARSRVFVRTCRASCFRLLFCDTNRPNPLTERSNP